MRRLIVPAGASQAQLANILTVVCQELGTTFDPEHPERLPFNWRRGLPDGVLAGWVRCAKPRTKGGCWYGEPNRPDGTPRTRCPRCGDADVVLLVAPATAGASYLLEDGHDVPDGLQVDELLPGDFTDEDLQRIPVPIVRAIRRQARRVSSLEEQLAALTARVAALEGP